jgi:crotonobetainyl-CoA:carnitine CoA-transferase CaiB-like acyl-CoA transferase
MAALLDRERSGRVQSVETSMLEAMCHFNLDDFTHYFAAGQTMGPQSRPSVSQSYVFRCADDRWIALHMSSPEKFWQNLAVALGRPDMLHMPTFATRAARIANYEDALAFMAPIFATQPMSYWEQRLRELEVPNAPVLAPEDVVDSAQAKHLGLILESDGPRGRFQTIRSPVRLGGKRDTQVTAPPVLGADNDSVLGVPPGPIDAVTSAPHRSAT